MVSILHEFAPKSLPYSSCQATKTPTPGTRRNDTESGPQFGPQRKGEIFRPSSLLPNQPKREWTSAQKIFHFHLVSEVISGLNLFRNQRETPQEIRLSEISGNQREATIAPLGPKKAENIISDNIPRKKMILTKPYNSRD